MSRHPTIDGLVRSLHEAADGGSAIQHHRDTMREAAETISQLRDLLKPFAKEADEYNGWAGLVLVEADEEGGVREAWYSMADLRAARAAVKEPRQ